MRIMAVCPHSGAGTSKGKTAHHKGPVSLSKLNNLSSPGSAESGRQVTAITGKKTDQTHQSRRFPCGWNGGQAKRQRSTASKIRKHQVTSSRHSQCCEPIGVRALASRS